MGHRGACKQRESWTHTHTQMNTNKERERDRVTHLKTQTHVRTQTGPVELELMWPEAAQRPATHTLHSLKSHLQLQIQPTERLYC